MKIRDYGADSATADGHDEGGYFMLTDVPELTAKQKRRMERCRGCRNDFYNGRANSGGANTCYSMDNDANFRKRGTPVCFHS